MEYRSMSRHRLITVLLYVVVAVVAANLASTSGHAASVPSPPPPLLGRPIMPSVVIRAIIRDAFRHTGVGRKAVRVARCESGLDPYATNGQYRGLFQLSLRIRQRIRELTGWSNVGYSAWENSRGARYLWRGEGWAAWPACRYA